MGGVNAKGEVIPNHGSGQRLKFLANRDSVLGVRVVGEMAPCPR